MNIELSAIVIGDAGVGKTSLAVAMEKKKPMPGRGRTEPTIGVDFTTIPVFTKDGSHVTVRLWDTAGQERYRALLPAYFRRKAVVLLVFDVTNTESFNSCVTWMRMVTRYADEYAHVVLVGTKRDLRDRKPTEKCVPWSKAHEWAAGRGLPYREVSAVTLDGVHDLLLDAVAKVVTDRPEHLFDKPGVWIVENENTTSSSTSRCCPG